MYLLNDKLSDQQVEDLMNQLFESSPTGICLLKGPEHIFVYANEIYRNIIGIYDIIGKRVMDVLPEVKEQGFIDLLDHVYQNDEAYSASEVPITIDSSDSGEEKEIFVNFVYQPIKDENQEVSGIFVDVQDITSFVRQRKELEHVNSVKQNMVEEIKDRFSYMMSLSRSMFSQPSFPKYSKLNKNQDMLTKIKPFNNNQLKQLFLENEIKLMNLKPILHHLVEQNMADKDLRVSFESDEPIFVNVDQAMPLAILAEELVLYLKSCGQSDTNFTLESNLNHLYLNVSAPINIAHELENLSDSAPINLMLIGSILDELEAEYLYDEKMNHFTIKIAIDAANVFYRSA